jgi:hypothetical protein
MQVLVLTNEYENKGEVIEVSQTAFARDLYIDSKCRVYDLSLLIPEIIPISEISKVKETAQKRIKSLQEVLECIETYENPIEKQRIK